MNKIDLYIDFDSTIANSDKAVCRIYNEKYKEYEGFEYADWRKHRDWTYKFVCPLIHKFSENPVLAVKEYYGSSEFFKYLDLYDGVREVINLLKEKYNIIICTSAFPKNASRKVLWIEENLPEIDEIIIIINKNTNGSGKGRVPMMEKNSIFIDDHPDNLKSTGASQKYLFKMKDTNYNGDWDGDVVRNWQEIKGKLL